MAQIKVDGRYIDVSLLEELEPYELLNAKRSGDKIVASSPFRDDSSPSFFINVGDNEYAGTWGDSGASDEYWSKGNLVKLLSFFRNETYEETVDYLLSKYDYEYVDTSIKIEVLPLDLRQGNIEVPSSRYKGKPLDQSYLIGRGIHPKVIEMNEVFDNGNSVGIIWRDTNGKVANIKYRMKEDKTFWYERGATPINRLVYGLNHVIVRGIKRIVICEAEIDAMTWQSAGIFGVAVGGASLNDYQADLIVASGVEEVILGGDFDESGARFNRIVENKLRNKIPTIKNIRNNFNNQFKDANELGIIRLGYIEFIDVPITKALKI
ncbi:toprim domain-containing protein [Mammaliicoccus sciuri]|uniref:toprim domain-containing protein n=1 Tax=Mammaliicoccus sciuri TaxID=1296 RepID=UPI0034DD4112